MILSNLTIVTLESFSSFLEFRIHWTSWSCTLFSPSFENFSHYFFKYSFYSPTFSSPLGTPIPHILGNLNIFMVYLCPIHFSSLCFISDTFCYKIHIHYHLFCTAVKIQCVFFILDIGIFISRNSVKVYLYPPCLYVIIYSILL